MSWSLKVGRLLGIDIKIHFTFLIILVWGALNYGGSAGPLYGILVTLALFTLVFLHELGHSVAALWYGIPVKDITLLPIGGVARLERMPEKPIQELVVAIAGPAVNVVLALLLLPVVGALVFSQAGFYGSIALSSLLSPGLTGLLTFLLIANISLVVFNMIPAFPLDGGRVFRATLGFFTSYENATKLAVQVGRVFAILLGIFGLFTGQIFMALIAFFIFMAGGQEGQAVAIKSALSRVKAEQALSDNHMAISPHATVGQVASMMLSNPYPIFPVLNPDDGDLLGVASSSSVAQAMQEGHWYKNITEIMHPARLIPKISLNTPLIEAQEKLTGASSQVVAVYDGLHYKGLITANDIYRVFRFFSQSGYSTPHAAAS
jgi:stage IV sporulation protein FB